MLTIVGIAGMVECPDPTNSGIVDTEEKCTNCSYLYKVHMIRNNLTTVGCHYDEGDYNEEI